MYDHTLMVTVSARMLNDLASLAAGYTMSRGNFISTSVIREANEILYDEGYEYGQQETLF